LRTSNHDNILSPFNRIYKQPKDGAAPHSALISYDTRLYVDRRRKKLLDLFHDQMRTRHYAMATEKSYRHWIVEFLHFHHEGGNWRHPAKMGKPDFEAFLTHLAIDCKVSAKTQNQAFSAILFLYEQVLMIELPKINALRAKDIRRASFLNRCLAALPFELWDGAGLAIALLPAEFAGGFDRSPSHHPERTSLPVVCQVRPTTRRLAVRRHFSVDLPGVYSNVRVG
jgi:hypothetical protein